MKLFPIRYLSLFLAASLSMAAQQHTVTGDAPELMVGRLILDGKDTELAARFTEIAQSRDEAHAIAALHAWEDELLKCEAPDLKACFNILQALKVWCDHECDREPEFMLRTSERYLLGSVEPPEARAENLRAMLRFYDRLQPEPLSSLDGALFGTRQKLPLVMLVADPAAHCQELMVYPHMDMKSLVRPALHDSSFLTDAYLRRGLLHWQYEHGRELPPAVRRAMELMTERRDSGRAVTAADLQEIRRMAADMEPQLQGFIPRCMLALAPDCRPWAPLSDRTASLFLMPDTSAVTLPQWDDALFGAPTSLQDDLAALEMQLAQPRFGTLAAFALQEAEAALPKDYLRAQMGVEGYDEFTEYITLTLLRDGIDIVCTPQGPRFSADDADLQQKSRALQLALHRCVLKLACLERDGRKEELAEGAEKLAGALNRANAWPLLINEYELRGVSPAVLHALLGHFRGTPTVQRALATTLLGDGMMRHLGAVNETTDMASPVFLGLLDPAKSAEEKARLRDYVYREFAEESGWPKGVFELPKGGDARLRALAVALEVQMYPERWCELVRMLPSAFTERYNLLCGDTMPLAARRALMEKMVAEGHGVSAAYLAESFLYRACVSATPTQDNGSHADIVDLRREADAWRRMPVAAGESAGLPVGAACPKSPYPALQPGDYEWHFTSSKGKPEVFRAGIISLRVFYGADAGTAELRLRKTDGQEITVHMEEVSEQDYPSIAAWYELNHLQEWSEKGAVAVQQGGTFRARLVDRYRGQDSLYNLVKSNAPAHEMLIYLTPDGDIRPRDYTPMTDALKRELEERRVPIAEGETELRICPGWCAALNETTLYHRAATAVFIGRRGSPAEQAWQKLLADRPDVITGLNHGAALVLCYTDEQGNWDENARAAASSFGVQPREGMFICTTSVDSQMPQIEYFWRSPEDQAAVQQLHELEQALLQRRGDMALNLLAQRPALARCATEYHGTVLAMAAERGMIHVVRRMLTLGADPMERGDNPETGSCHDPAVIRAVAGGQQVFTEVMRAAGQTVSSMEDAHLSPYRGLILASGSGHLKPEQLPETIAWVRGMGFDINAPDADGMPPLQRAVDLKNLPAVRALMQAGASSDNLVFQQTGNVPFGLAGYQVLPYFGRTVPRELTVAVVEGGYNVNITSPQTPHTMLSIAVFLNDADMVDLLLRHGASADTTFSGIPMLAYSGWLTGDARRAGRDDSAQDEVVKQQLRIAELLLQHGANINAPATSFGSILDYASGCRRRSSPGIERLADPRFVKWLKAHGARSARGEHAEP